jgi:hypothetical protein
VIVASGRLARGNPSVAIAVDPHLTALLNVVRRWRMAVAGGQERRAAAVAASMRQIAHDTGRSWRLVSEVLRTLTRTPVGPRRRLHVP